MHVNRKMGHNQYYPSYSTGRKLYIIFFPKRSSFPSVRPLYEWFSYFPTVIDCFVDTGVFKSWTRSVDQPFRTIISKGLTDSSYSIIWLLKVCSFNYESLLLYEREPKKESSLLSSEFSWILFSSFLILVFSLFLGKASLFDHSSCNVLAEAQKSSEIFLLAVCPSLFYSFSSD